MHYENMNKYKQEIVRLASKIQKITDDFFAGNPWYNDYGEQRLLRQVNSITQGWVDLNAELRGRYGYKHSCRENLGEY